MSTRDEELRKLYREAAHGAPAPEFRATWRGAKARAGDGRRGTAWRWALGPALAAVSIAVVLGAVRGLGVPVPRAGRDAPAVAAIAPQAPVAVADAGASPAAEGGAVETAANEEGLYVAGTDFLLEMEIPAWN